jgi:hypothetical protein
MDTDLQGNVGRISGEVLPEGYTEDPDRRCVFSIETFSGGAKGLAYAVLLRAVEDGCDAHWLQEIADAYGIVMPDEVLGRTPKHYVRLNLSGRGPIAVDGTPRRGRLILAWEDALSTPKWMRNGNVWTNLRLTA